MLDGQGADEFLCGYRRYAAEKLFLSCPSLLVKLMSKFENILPNKNTTQSLLNNYNIGILSVMIKKKIFDHKKFDEKVPFTIERISGVKLIRKYRKSFLINEYTYIWKFKPFW